MLVTDKEVTDLKAWIVKKLENISDADSDVLADYVLALIRAEAPDEQLKANAIENLEDFTREHTSNFVDEMFQVIHKKSYIAGYVPPPATSNSSPILPIPSAVTDAFTPFPAQNGHSQAGSQSRKRSYNDANENKHGHDHHYGHGDRTMKQMRRGGAPGYGNRGNFHNPQQSFPEGSSGSAMQLPGMAGQSSNLPFNPNDTMAAMMAMQAMGIPLSGMPGAGSSHGLRVPGPGGSPGAIKNRINARCRDYDTKGFCIRGVACPFNHGDNSVIVPNQSQEYDPKTPTLTEFPSPIGGHSPMEDFRGRGRGRVRGPTDRGSHPPRQRTRAEFSMSGPNHDRSLTTIVVEQIPEENFEEEQVRAFFSTFGPILEITMKPYKRLALVKFDDYHSARAAYESPKVIFENRFVKVYWYKPDATAATSPGTNGITKPSESGSPSKSAAAAKPIETPEFDREKFQRDAEAAQKKLEERKALQQETDAKIADIEKKQQELAKKRDEEIQRMNEKLAAKGQTVPGSIQVDKENESLNGEKSKKSENTQKLRAQLKALEDEARSLGLDPDTTSPDRGRGTGRGRGRGGTYRGGYEPSLSRGSYRGRGGPFRGAVRAGGAFNLDNRPKSVKVKGVVFDDAKDEELKQFLFTVGEFTSLAPESPTDKTSQVITFKDRFTAEKFFYGTRDIPGVGKLEFSWVSNGLLPPVPVAGTVTKDGDTQMGGTEGDGGGGGGKEGRNGDIQGQSERELDYEVAEEEGDWID